MMISPFLQIVQVCFLAILTTAVSGNPVARTTLGDVEGTIIYFEGHGIHQYLGIPYAVPPIGDLRFKKPKPMQMYYGTLTANQTPPACTQYSIYPYPWYDDGPGQSEDCLLLNIWVPACSGFMGNNLFKYQPVRRSVMFWIYGGGFQMGSIRQPLYNGAPLAAIGDVIVVTVGYRLGAFGFLYSGTEDAPGNVGLFDVLEGLKWVRTNIAAFGGDPDKITIFGESAGASIASLLALSPLAKGLYQRLILESPSVLQPGSDSTIASNFNQSQELAKSVGCADDFNTLQHNPKKVVDCLRGVDPMLLAMKTAELSPHSIVIFHPQYGDEIVPINPTSAVLLEQFNGTPLLMGNNRDEGSLFLTTRTPDVFGFFGEKNTLVSDSTILELTRETLAMYGIEGINSTVRLAFDLYDDSDNRRRGYNVIGDALFWCSGLLFAEKFAQKSKDVYYYLFTRRPSTTPWAPWMGVAHYEEVRFVFGTPLLDQAKYTEPEKCLSREMIYLWTNFAKAGYPGAWPRFSKKEPVFRVLDTNLHFHEQYRSGRHQSVCELLHPLFTTFNA